MRCCSLCTLHFRPHPLLAADLFTYASLPPLQVDSTLAYSLVCLRPSTPADLFFYAFLPPLLVDSAIRIDFFMFRKVRARA